MRSIKVRSVALGIGVVVLVSGASFAKKPGSTPSNSDTLRRAEASTIIDGEGYAFVSDGAGPFLAEDVRTAFVYDFGTSVADDVDSDFTQDYLYLSTLFDGPRFASVNNPFVSAAEFGPGSSEPIQCRSTYFFFESEPTPDWFQAISAGEVVNGWGTAGCYTSETSGYHFVYPESGLVGEDQNCLTVRMGTGGTVVLETPQENALGFVEPTCWADIYSFDTSSGEWVPEFLGASQAPYALEMALETTNGPGTDKPGKGPKR